MKGKILIVDDEEDLVIALRQALLLEFPDSQVDVALSGEEGLSQLARSAYDLLIADLRMPGFNGLELIKGVRYLEPQVPIILMTAYGSESLWNEVAQLGVRYCFDKPFDIRDMLLAICDLLGQGADSG